MLRFADGDDAGEAVYSYQPTRRELAAGRVTKSGIARAPGVSRQRVQRMLEQ